MAEEVDPTAGKKRARSPSPPPGGATGAERSQIDQELGTSQDQLAFQQAMANAKAIAARLNLNVQVQTAGDDDYQDEDVPNESSWTQLKPAKNDEESNKRQKSGDYSSPPSSSTSSSATIPSTAPTSAPAVTSPGGGGTYGFSNYQPQASGTKGDAYGGRSLGSTGGRPMITTQTAQSFSSSSPSSSMKYDIPIQYVGLAIGKGGEKIKELQTLSGATIILSRDVKPGSQTREATITGTDEQMRYAWSLIDKIVNHGVQDVVNRGNEIKKDMVIPSNKVGLIIGKAGATVKEMKAMSGAFIQVSQKDTSSPSAIITISAKNQQSLEHATHLIEERLKLPPDPPNGPPVWPSRYNTSSPGATRPPPAADYSQHQQWPTHPAAAYPGYPPAAPPASGYPAYAPAAAYADYYNQYSQDYYAAYYGQPGGYPPAPYPPRK